MALLTLPCRKKIAHLSDRLVNHRLVKDVREVLPDLPTLPELPALAASLPEWSEIVGAALEAGSKHGLVMPAIPQRPRKRRRVGNLVLLVALVGGLAIAYRWWNGRRGDAAQLIDEPREPGDAPAVTPPPSPWATPASALNRREPAPGVSSMSQPKTEDQVESGSESATSAESAEPTVESGSTAHPASNVAPLAYTAEAPLRPARDETARPRLPLGRGLAPSMPSIPSRRPAMPGRPSSFHPR